MSTRTPQTRSQTKRTGTGTTTTGSTRVSSLEKTKSRLADFDPIYLVFSGAVVLFVSLSVAVVKQHKSLIKVPSLPVLTDRLIFTIQQQTISLVPLVFTLVHVMLTRLFSKARNPLSGHEKLVDKQVRILTNTLEQFILSAVNQLILVTFLPADHLYVIPFLVYTFVIGRIAFIIGYNIDPKYRTFGLALTFVPTFSVFAANLFYVYGLNKLVSLPISNEQSKKLGL